MDTFIIDGFQKLAANNNQQVGTVKLNLPLQQTQTLNQLLNQNAALFVKQYSPSALATTSMRGMSAQHTALVWNGINLQSCMNGLKDLNLIPMFFIENATLESGANNNLVGQGAIAGAIQLKNKLIKEKIIKFESNLGSFNNQQQAFSLTGFHKNLSFRTKVLHRNGLNNFQYYDYFKQGSPLTKLENNEYKQVGFMQELSYETKSSHRFYANFWAMESERMLPSPMGVASFANEQQNDRNYKAYLQHQFQINSKLSIHNKLCLLDEYIDYFHTNLAPALSRSVNKIIESELNFQFKPQLSITSSVNFTNQHAFSDGYRTGKKRDLITWLNKLDWLSKNQVHKLSLSLRSQMHNMELAPLAPEIGYEQKINSYLKLKANAAYCYRLPSFNDLFWLPGGNANLMPEKGRKAEITTVFAFDKFKFNMTAFHHLLNNWIIWLPSSSSSFWMAQNAKQVQSNGLEFSSEYAHEIKTHSKIKVISRYQFVNTINTKTYLEDEKSLGKQLIYTPNHSGMLGVSYQFRKLQLNVTSQYIGKLYTKSDNLEYHTLKPYLLLNIGLGYYLNYKKLSGECWFNVMNINNQIYQVMENRPMPLRNYQISLKININYDKN
ncbi:MAG: TonB-dependent receptor [Bacteroidota bacterium]|nr:TonB-dependent receptor [Bacteroidota bacterium]